MDQDDLSYLLRRVRQERQCAVAAGCFQARLVHGQIASAYERRLRAAGFPVAELEEWATEPRAQVG